MATILVIDDDADTREVVEKTLRQVGHEIYLACDGEEGLKVHHSRPVDLVISDLFMPNKEGVETITEICKESPQVAIIAMSGGHFASNQMLTIARMLGDVRILEKPFDADTLLNTVNEALR